MNLSQSPMGNDYSAAVDKMLATNPDFLRPYGDASSPHVALGTVFFTSPGSQSYQFSGRFVDDGSGEMSYVTETGTMGRPIRGDWVSGEEFADDPIFTGQHTATTRYEMLGAREFEEEAKPIFYTLNLLPGRFIA